MSQRSHSSSTAWFYCPFSKHPITQVTMWHCEPMSHSCLGRSQCKESVDSNWSQWMLYERGAKGNNHSAKFDTFGCVANWDGSLAFFAACLCFFHHFLIFYELDLNDSRMPILQQFWSSQSLRVLCRVQEEEQAARWGGSRGRKPGFLFVGRESKREWQID